jgi:hypothetical protein
MTNVKVVIEMTVVQLWQDVENYFLQHEVPNSSVCQHPASSSTDIELMYSKESEKNTFLKKQHGLLTWHAVLLDKFPMFRRQPIIRNVGNFSPNDSVTSKLTCISTNTAMKNSDFNFSKSASERNNTGNNSILMRFRNFQFSNIVR